MCAKQRGNLYNKKQIARNGGENLTTETLCSKQAGKALQQNKIVRNNGENVRNNGETFTAKHVLKTGEFAIVVKVVKVLGVH